MAAKVHIIPRTCTFYFILKEGSVSSWQLTHMVVLQPHALLIEVLSWGFLRPRQKGSHHEHAGPHDERLDPTTRVHDASVGYHWNAVRAGQLAHVVDGGDLRPPDGSNLVYSIEYIVYKHIAHTYTYTHIYANGWTRTYVLNPTCMDINIQR